MWMWIYLLLALLLGGCGASGTGAASPAEVINQRVELTGTQVRAGWSSFAFQCARVDSLQGFEPVVGVAWLEGGQYRFGPATADQLDGRRGYWLYSDGDARLGYAGQDDGRTPEIPVQAGWNLVSFACTYPVRVADVTPRDILLYEAGPDGAPRAVDTVTPGRACWVYSLQPAKLRWTLPVRRLELAPAATVVRLLGAQQLALRATLEDGSTANVTELAAWSSEKPSVAGISQTGVTTGLTPGVTEVTATFQDLTARAAVNVIDPAEGLGGGPGEGGGGGFGPAPPAPSPSPSPSPSATLERRSVSSAGTQGDAASFEPSASTDARYVAFASNAANLVVGDTNGGTDVFRHDRVTGTTIRLSTSAAGAQRVAPVEEDRPTADISGDGRYVVFDSRSDNLVPDDLNESTDIFIKDCDTGALALVSAASDGTPADYDSLEHSLSQDGTWIAFTSWATNLAPGDNGESQDVFLKNRVTGAVVPVTLQANDEVHSPSLSADGTVCVFQAAASNLVVGDTNNESDIFVWEGGTLERVGGNSGSYNPRVSRDGRYVAFESDATDLVVGDTNGERDVFIYDRTTGGITRVAQGTRPSWSPNGAYLGFETGLALVASDTNGQDDVYVYAVATATISKPYTVNALGGGSVRAALASGWVCFLSGASNLVTGDTNGVNDVFAAPWP